MAPEVWGFVEKGSPYAADIWALGETVFEMLAKKPSFRLGSLALYKSERDFPSKELHNSGVGQLGIDFVKSLMQPHPNDRLTAKAALADPWIETMLIEPVQKLQITQRTQENGRAPSPVASLTEEYASWTTPIQSRGLKEPTPEPQNMVMSSSEQKIVHELPKSKTTRGGYIYIES